mmetsp:Transcript_14800/g.41660  ORF Transcript_14800/g.41660 Transcript_14800/m.41660 type:complete len:237 (+) Transcript_14800:259-969(+)
MRRGRRRRPQRGLCRSLPRAGGRQRGRSRRAGRCRGAPAAASSCCLPPSAIARGPGKRWRRRRWGRRRRGCCRPPPLAALAGHPSPAAGPRRDCPAGRCPPRWSTPSRGRRRQPPADPGRGAPRGRAQGRTAPAAAAPVGQGAAKSPRARLLCPRQDPMRTPSPPAGGYLRRGPRGGGDGTAAAAGGRGPLRVWRLPTSRPREWGVGCRCRRRRDGVCGGGGRCGGWRRGRHGRQR